MHTNFKQEPVSLLVWYLALSFFITLSLGLSLKNSFLGLFYGLILFPLIACFIFVSRLLRPNASSSGWKVPLALTLLTLILEVFLFKWMFLDARLSDRDQMGAIFVMAGALLIGCALILTIWSVWLTRYYQARKESGKFDNKPI